MTREEAIKEIKSWAIPSKKGREILETLIPELAESEDERIRKEIITIVKNETGWQQEFPSQDQCLAWLEKQKDANKAIEVVDRIDKYIDEHLANAHDMKDSNPDKKYYRGWDDALGEMARILQDVYSNEKQEEQKPILSDRDLTDFEIEVHEIIAQARNDSRLNDADVLKQFEEEAAFALMLKANKLIEQKPAEWSEEDEEMLEYIIGDVNDAKQLYTTQEVKNMAYKEIAWLKSLRPSWKPNDEDEVRLINTSISFLKDFADKGYENAVECIDWLKSKLNGTSTNAK